MTCLILETKLIIVRLTSRWKKVKDLHETLIKFTNVKEKLDLILSSQSLPWIILDWCLDLVYHMVKTLKERNWITLFTNALSVIDLAT